MESWLEKIKQAYMKENFIEIQKMAKENIGETSDYGGTLFTAIGIIMLISSFYCMSIGYDYYYILLLGVGSYFLIGGNNWLIHKRNAILSEIQYKHSLHEMNLGLIYKKKTFSREVFS